MKTRVVFFVPLLLIASLVLATCTANGGSIYATIENEQKISVSSLSQNSASTLVIADITKAGGNYYVAAGGVFQGVFTPPTVTASSVTWNPAAVQTSPPYSRPYNPKGTDGSIMLCTALTTLGGNLYGGFYTPTGSQYGLYVCPIPATNSSATWTSLTLPTAGEQVVLLQVANGTLFIAGTSPDSNGNYSSYELDYFNGTSVAPIMGGLNRITGIAYDGTNYYVSTGTSTTGSTLYVSSTPTGFTPTSTVALSPALVSGDQINSIFGDSVNHLLFVTTGAIPAGVNVTEDGLYILANGTLPWTHIGAPVYNSISVPLLCVAGPIDSSGDYLVGADGYGYYYYNYGANTLTQFSDTTVALYAESVGKILVDGTHVFMGTNANGLWGAEFTGTSASLASGTTWIHE